MKESIWNRQRRNYKVYLDDPVPLELEQRLDEIIKICPIQRSGNGTVQIYKVTQDDTDIKELFSEFVFKNNSNGYTEIAPITAPLVYFCCMTKAAEKYDRLHAGIIGGAMMTETLNSGYDFSFIGCTEEPDKKYRKRLNACLRENYGITYKVKPPFLALCIGKGIEPRPSNPKLYTLQNGRSVMHDSCINTDDPKPQVLFVKKS
jgi:hypothetical protein|tara:strand:- start:58 stop:669 length:612 start_codon:yes stop_codon:yes gene_type:complete